jgi:hypothetical protein
MKLRYSATAATAASWREFTSGIRPSRLDGLLAARSGTACFR